MATTKEMDRAKLRETVMDLLQSGAHFGHSTHHWNPKMASYIFTERGGQHVIDLEQTAKALWEAKETVKDVAARGGKVIFVGTKRQAQQPVREAAAACGMPYVNIRWLGGTLTNWKTISQRIKYLNDREAQYDAGEFNSLSKKERLGIEKEIAKLNRRLGGIKELTSPPDMVFAVDTNGEELAVKESKRTNRPLMAMVDTNCDPDPVDFVIPSNDDSHRPIRYITGVIAKAIQEGTDMHLKNLVSSGRDDEAAAKYEEPVYDIEDPDEVTEEELLGPSVLKRIAEGDDEEEGEAPTGETPAETTQSQS